MKIVFLFTFFLFSCVSLPKREDVCKTDVEVIRSSYSLTRYIADSPFKIAYYPTVKLHNLGNQCESYISQINEIGDYFFDKFYGKSIKEMEIALNKERYLNLNIFEHMLPSSGKQELKSGEKIQIEIYRFKEMETIFHETLFHTKIKISKFY